MRPFKGRTCIQVPLPGWSRLISDDLEELVEKDGANKLGGIVDELEEGGERSQYQRADGANIAAQLYPTTLHG